MNAENYEYLTEQVLPRLGFPQALDDTLLAKMKVGGDMIKLEAVGNFGKDKMEYSLHLEKVEDRYYLNAVKATITKENEQPQSHTFSLYSQKGYNADEMYNMMDNRFVYREFMKDGEKLGRWSTVDLLKKDENGNGILRSYYDNTTNFNLVIELGKLPLTYMSPQDKESLIRDMKAGEPGIASIKRPDGSRERVSLVPKPNIGTILLFDKEGKKIKLDQKKIQGVDNRKFTVKEEVVQEIPPATTKLLEKANNGEQAEGKETKLKNR